MSIVRADDINFDVEVAHHSVIHLLSFAGALPWYFALPQLNGKYLYLIMCLI